MHKHFLRGQTFLCGTNHASPACQPRTKTDGKECTRLHAQKVRPWYLWAKGTKRLQSAERKGGLVNAACMLLASCLGTLLIVSVLEGDALSEKQQRPLECLGELCTMDCFVPKLILTHNLA